jgi:hypothetical protein
MARFEPIGGACGSCLYADYDEDPEPCRCDDRCPHCPGLVFDTRHFSCMDCGDIVCPGTKDQHVCKDLPAPVPSPVPPTPWVRCQTQQRPEPTWEEIMPRDTERLVYDREGIRIILSDLFHHIGQGESYRVLYLYAQGDLVDAHPCDPVGWRVLTSTARRMLRERANNGRK